MTLRQDSQTRRPQTRSAFTLTELLVVIAVLSLLATMIVPTVKRAAAIGRQTHCAKKLRAICEAYQIRIQMGISGMDDPFDVNNSWAAQLRDQVGGHVRAFYCVEDPAPRKSATMPRLERRWDGVYGDPVPLELFDADPVWDEMPLSDLGADGPGVWKVSSETYASLNLQQGVSQLNNLPQYEPGDTPDVYYMLINDEGSGGGDADYEDLIFRVEEDIDGTITISTQHLGYTVFTHDLHGPLLDVMDVGKYQGVEYVFKSHGPISYGMTAFANRRGFGTRTILALDFKKDVVHPNMTNPAEEWDEFVAPRHLGKCNVVFGDGSVKLLDPDEVTTADPDIRKDIWERMD